MRRSVLVILIIAILSWILSACGRGTPTTAPQAGNAEIRIGVLADKTGFMSGHGESTEMGAMLATDELNRSGGILGKKVRLIVLDSQSDPAITAERVRELVERDDVDLVMGTGTSAATLAAIPVVTRAKTPFIYALDGECKTCALGSPERLNPYVFGSGFTERMVVRPLLEFVASKLGKPADQIRVFFVGGDYVYPHTTNAYAGSVARNMGMKIVGEEYSPTDTTDYSPLIRKIMDASPELLIVTNPGASGVTFMRQAQQFELPKKMVVSGFATFDQEAIDAMGTASEGVYCINRYSPLLPNKANAEFVSAFRARFPKKPLLPGPTAAAGSYGALMTAAKAFTKAATLDGDAFAAAMDNLEVDLPQGTIRVDGNNHVFQQPLYIMQIRDQHYHIVQEIQASAHPGFEGCSVN